MDVNNKVLNLNSDIKTYKSSNITNEDKTKSTSTKNNSNEDKNFALSKEGFDRLVTEANDKFKVINKQISYNIHKETNRVFAKIKDAETGEVMKEIPSEESLDLSAKLKDMVGLLIDEKS